MVRRIFSLGKIALALASAALLAACEGLEKPGGKTIGVNVSLPETKAGAAIVLDGLKNEGFVMNAWRESDAENAYFTENVTYDNDRTPYKWATANTQYWLNKEMIRFWCWNMDALSGRGLSASGAYDPSNDRNSRNFSFTVPGTAANRGDVVMAYTHYSWDDDGDYAVDINFKHPLSRICFVGQIASNDIDITSVAIKNVNTHGDFTFTGDGSGSASFAWNGQDNLGTVTETDGVSKSNIDNINFYLPPQNLDENVLLSVTFHNTSTDEYVTRTASLYKSDDAQMKRWEADHYYKYRIKLDGDFTNSLVLSIDLLDWDLEERFLEIKDESVGKYLTYNSSTATIQSAMSRIYIKNNQPVTGSFKLTSPKGAKLLLALDGNLDAFKVEPKITYVDDNDVNFTITPLIQDPKIDYHTQLHIYLVHPDSSVSELDEDVMREGGVYKHYTIILPQQ